MFAATPLSLLVSTINAVYTQVRLTQSNQEQCQLLANRLGHMQQILPKTPEEIARIQGQRFTDALNNCYQTAQNCLNHITYYVGQKWYKHYYHAGNDKAAFIQLNAQIDQSQQLLTTALAMHQMHIQQEHQEWQKKIVLAQQQDHEMLKQRLKEIESLMRKQIEQNIAQLPGAEQESLKASQFQALKNQLHHHTKQESDFADTVDEQLHLEMADLIFAQLIARGGVGSVYAGSWQSKSVAIKIINALNDVTRNELIREVKIIGRLNHPNIVPFYGACLDPGFECLVMKHMEQGTLSEYLTQHAFLTFEQQRKLILDLLEGLVYLHGQGIIHRDLKAANILIHQDQLHISDFGLAKLKNSLSIQSLHKLPTSDVSCAPELIQGQQPTEKMDIYSVGWLLWHIVSETPWPQATQTKMYPSLHTVPSVYRALIEQCWHSDPNQRPDAKTLLQRCQAIQAPTAKELDTLFTQAQAKEASSDYSQAQALFEQAAKHGHIKSAYSLGMLYANRRLAFNQKAMLHYLTQAADAKYFRAQYNLARIYEKGELAKVNSALALSLYQEVVDNPQTPEDIKTAAQNKIQMLAAIVKIDDTKTNKLKYR